MLSRSKQSIIIPQPTKPIYLTKQLQLTPISSFTSLTTPNHGISRFLISCIDRKLVLVEIDHSRIQGQPPEQGQGQETQAEEQAQEKGEGDGVDKWKGRGEGVRFRYDVVGMDSVVSAVYWEWMGEGKGMMYLGCWNGDVVSMRVGIADQHIKLLPDSCRYREQNNFEDKEVILVYAVKKQIFTFNLASELRIIESLSMKVIKFYKFSHNITASCYFHLECIPHPVGCVSFNTPHPPTLFTSPSLQNLIQTYTQSQPPSSPSSSPSSPSSPTPQITTICDSLHQSPQPLLLCSAHTPQINTNSIIVYTIKQHEGSGQRYLEMLYRFQVRGFVLGLSCLGGLGMIFMGSCLVGFLVEERRRILGLEKGDLGVCGGVVLGVNDDGVKFMAYKGFNFMEPHVSKKYQLKVRIRYRNFDKQK